MNLKTNDIVLVVLTVCCILLMFTFGSIPQDPAYHKFADQRNIWGVSNFYNVITNLPFFIIGWVGLLIFLRRKNNGERISVAYFTLLIGVMGIGLGSAWYHYHPTNETLVWDRIPMTVTFMSFFSIVVSRYVSSRLGNIVLIPLLIVGVFSVFYWYFTEQHGHGDLRLYALIQFYPMICIPLILFLYPTAKSVRVKIVLIILVYVIAKIAEHDDEVIYNFHHIISGHSLKHLFASASVLLILLAVKDETVRRGKMFL